MKFKRLFNKLSSVIAIAALSLLAFIGFSLFMTFRVTWINKSQFDLRSFFYSRLNTEQLGVWNTPNPFFFSKQQGSALFTLIGDADYFLETNFEQGISAIKMTFNEIRKISSSSIDLFLVEGYYSKSNQTLYFPDQVTTVEFVHTSRAFFSKNCLVSASVKLNGRARTDLRNFQISLTSDDCPEIPKDINLSTEEIDIKSDQMIFHVVFTSLLLLLQYAY